MIIAVLGAVALSFTLHGPAQWQRWASQAQVPLPAEAVTLRPGACPDGHSGACTSPDWQVVYLPAHASRRRLYHELGHRFDYSSLRHADRMEFARLRGDRRGWREPPNSLAEQFAEAYALCALGPGRPTETGRMMGAYSYRPTAGRHRAICAWLGRVDQEGKSVMFVNWNRRRGVWEPFSDVTPPNQGKPIPEKFQRRRTAYNAKLLRER